MTKFNYKKSLGQNFLKDDSVLEKIINSVEINSNDLVLEIGPGNGALTKKIKGLNVRLIAFEIDERLKFDLEKLRDEKTNFIYGDFMQIDVDKILENETFDNVYVIANLPYYITTPIVEKIINLKITVKQITIMVQNEVADRFAAKPKTSDYGSLTVFLNYYFQIEKLFVVKRTSFEPVPNVDSAVVRFTRLEEKYRVNNEEVFFKLLRDSFKQKRKNIKNNLYDYDLKIIEDILAKNNLSLQSRAEEMPIEVFIQIANAIS